MSKISSAAAKSFIGARILLRSSGSDREAVAVVTSQHNGSERVFRTVSDYEAGPVSKQILRIVLSYVDYINRTVWHKE